MSSENYWTRIPLRLQVRQFLVLTALTVLEVVRRPICLLLTATCVLLTAATPMMLLHQFGEEGKLARDSGLAFHFIFGLFVAGIAACSSLSREMHSGTAAAVLSKPISRGVFFLAKFAGLVVVIMAFSTCTAAVTLLSERVAERFESAEGLVGYIIDWRTGRTLLAAPFVAFFVAGILNYAIRRPFESTAFGLLLVSLLVMFLISGFFDRAGHLSARFDFAVEWRIVPAFFVASLGLAVLSTIALLLSTRLSTVPTLTICVLIFLVGLLSDYVFGRHVDHSAVASFLYRIVPNWQHFWMADALNREGSVPLVYVTRAASYATVYSVAFLCFGVLSFRCAEVK